MIILPLFISGAEIVFILFILIMVFGADKIPEIARFFGKTMKSFRHATDEIKTEITKQKKDHNLDFDIKKEVEDQTRTLDDKTSKLKDEVEDAIGPIKRRF
ncbi:Sec-independent protein translocase subunit TatA/TatB [Psychroflexus sediminis]|uniref:Sec-independent protein translocase protein TatA n=1 Tax=Psychroflexus sediminis TaxID=470826 RepID=A0A1G7VR97_9FLAO|nr:twin-arginine translocase TatA/TatE family subunit [Psychroflexus sediminis]SDG62273.1 sec-independent protein translocase protein TatA [Psychroflexus sediminis]